MKKRIMVLFVVLTMGWAMGGCSKLHENTQLNISAAASLKEAMEDIQESYKNENSNVELVVNYGSSGSLQKQIEQGAPCDVFISAGKKQMNELKEKELLELDTIKDLVKNQLVLIAPKDSKITSINEISNEYIKKIALGEINSVPAGKYADETLINSKLKDKVEDKLVFAKDVKEVLAWVQSGNADLGFVYYSDAVNNDKVKIVETISKDSHSPITYPVSLIKASKNLEESKKFEDFLLGEKGQLIFEKYGYKEIK